MSIARYYLNIVDHAIETAPLQAPPHDFNSSYMAFYAEQPDDCMIPVNTEWEAAPGQAVIEDTSEFEALYAALELRTGLVCRPSDIELIARHEGQHANAARTLGCINSVFGIMLEKTDDIRAPKASGLHLRAAFHASLDFRTTKLGHALIYAHPIDESLADMQNIRDLGYKSVGEIGQKAIDHNSQFGYELPVPLNFR